MRDDQDIPLLDMEPSASPLIHRRKTKKLTPCRFCVGLVVLFVGASVGLFLWTIGNLALVDLAKARNPHLAHRHPKNESMEEIGESNLVRSFYGEAKDGGVDHFDVIASVYHRVMIKNQTEVVAQLEGGEGALAVVSDEDEPGTKGGLKDEDPESLVWGPWERIFSEVVLERMSLKSKSVKAVSNVTLPGRILPSLRNSTRKVNLWASFSIFPSSLETPLSLIPINATYYLTKNASDPSSGNTYPGPWPLIGNTVEAQNLANQTEFKSWRSQLVRFSVGQDLLREVIPWVEKKEEVVEEGEGSGVALLDETVMVKGEKGSKGKAHVVVSRSMVTMVRDSAVYSLAPFRKQMEVLGESQRKCNLLFAGKLASSKLKGPIPDCKSLSNFAVRGHFESLYEMGTEEDAIYLEEKRKAAKQAESAGGEVEEVMEEEARGVKGWRYGPFIQANFGSSGPADLISLGNGTDDVPGEEPDLSFDWHLTFTTSSPLKVALGTGLGAGYDGGPISSNRSAHAIAGGQDKAELFNALVGHPFNPSTRPLLRKFLQTLSSILTFVSVLIQGHFWITRSVTTGISMPAQIIDSIHHYVFFVWQGWREEDSDGGFWLGVVVMTICSSVVWALALRLEFDWWGWVPIRVRRRRATHSERASSRLDMRFNWKQRGLVFIGLLLISLLILKLPYLIHASPPRGPAPQGSIVYTDKTWYLKYIANLNQTSDLILFTSQFLLNHRARTFGNNYRFVAALNLLSYVVHALPVLLSSRWGRWELMDPWEVSDLLAVGMEAAYAWQAWNLPEVKQEEEEDE